jgi:hypothetical protein
MVLLLSVELDIDEGRIYGCLIFRKCIEIKEVLMVIWVIKIVDSSIFCRVQPPAFADIYTVR